jgi:tetratricopeptide (TPR) repeat protein
MFFALSTLLATAAGAEETWARARSGRVEVITDASPAYARAAAEHVESFDRVLRSALPGVAAPEARAPLVLALADAGSFSRFVPAHVGEPHAVDGVVLGGADRTYIAVDLGARRDAPFEPLAHEYVHFVLNATLPAQPAWMGEGLADLLAAASAEGGSIAIGRPIAAHVERLARGPAMPLAEVLEVGYLSRTYLGDRGREAFYARAWALTHWIVAGGHGGFPGLLAFSRAVADGEDAGTAFARCFGMSAAAADAALAAYLARPLPVLALPVVAPAPALVETDTPPRPVVDRHLAEVLLRGGRVAEARGLLRRALDAAPASASTHEGLAAVALREGKVADALAHVEAAQAAAPDDPRVLLRRAELILRQITGRGDVPTDTENARAVALLERAVAADPDLADAADLLARLRPAPLAQRIALLRRAVARQPERAELAFTLAGLHIKRNDTGEAARVLRRARDRTRDESHRFLATHLLSRIGEAAGGIGEARGMLEAVECLEGGALAFRVRTPAGVLRLSAASPREVFLFDADGETYERELACGPAALAVTARYRLGPAGASTHLLVSLSFDAS